MIKIQKIKGPIRIKKGEIQKELLDIATKNLPFEATGWTSSKNEQLIPQAYLAKTGNMAEKDKTLDNYLTQNAKTVIKALKEDKLEKETLKQLYDLEIANRNRPTILEIIENLMEA